MQKCFEKKRKEVKRKKAKTGEEGIKMLVIFRVSLFEGSDSRKEANKSKVLEEERGEEVEEEEKQKGRKGREGGMKVLET